MKYTFDPNDGRPLVVDPNGNVSGFHPHHPEILRAVSISHPFTFLIIFFLPFSMIFSIQFIFLHFFHFIFFSFLLPGLGNDPPQRNCRGEASTGRRTQEEGGGRKQGTRAVRGVHGSRDELRHPPLWTHVRVRNMRKSSQNMPNMQRRHHGSRKSV